MKLSVKMQSANAGGVCSIASSGGVAKSNVSQLA
jgi:hypothetical protein